MNDHREDEIRLNFSRRQKAGRPKKADSPPPRVPRIARLMALAIKFQDMVDLGEVRDYAEIARLGYVTRARLTQIMNLVLLAPDIQEALLDADPKGCILEHRIRSATEHTSWAAQRVMVAAIVAAPQTVARIE